MSSFLAKARLYAHTLPHLRPEQVTGRLRPHGWSRSLPKVPKELSAGTLSVLGLEHDPWNDREAMLRGAFRFLSETRDLGWPPRFGVPEAPLLWQFNLHYFSYLHLLSPDERRVVMRRWIEENPPGSQPGWHSYPTSLRILAWMRSGVKDHDILESLYLQAAHLSRHVEFHVLGNHLLENARALVVAGRFFGGVGESGEWERVGLSIWRSQLPEQILGDGFHFELSPMYHALMLGALLEVLGALGPGHEAFGELARVAERMGDVLQGLVGSGDRVPLFNDSTEEIAPLPSRLLAALERQTGYRARAREDFPEAGYWVSRLGGAHLVIDAGPAGPSYLMAHAHADVFSFELHVGGELLVADTGVYQYQAGFDRDRVRKTSAHNTVTVAGLDSQEVWGSFRVGRRFAPGGVRVQRSSEMFELEGTLGAFGALLGGSLVHRRRFRHEPNRLEIWDELIGDSRDVPIASWLHLGPGVVVESKGPDVCFVRSGRVRAEIRCHRPFEVGTSKYHPRFGVSIDRPMLVARETRVPSALSWTLVMEPGSV